MVVDASLTPWSKIRQELEEANSLSELSSIRDKAEALRQYAKKQKESVDQQNGLAEVTLRCTRRMGELLLEMPKNKGIAVDAPSWSHRATTLPPVSPPTLEDIGITKHSSSRCQTIAKLPLDLFEQYIEATKAKHDELTQAGLLQLAKSERRRQKEEERERKRDENRQLISEAETPEEAVATAKFSTILIDPPWDWGDEGDNDQLGRSRPTYGTMSIEQLLNMPVGDYADENCHLYLWITNRSLPKGFRLLEAWGFRYVTCITWVKPYFGMGNYFRGKTEHMLFGVKGSSQLKRADAPTCFNAPRGPNGHSSKPLEAYSFIESCSHGPYLEMFARSERPDWTSWGAEV
jgi:N6-adenosine-specific RNA methylase IME4